MRVVCEFCQTVYNIPDEKLVRDTSQAKCKVCKNKIMIRRTPAAGAEDVTSRSTIPDSPSTDPTLPRVPTATPTRISDAVPASPPSMATTEPSAPAIPIGSNPIDDGVPETELSNSWREAIVDNRTTIDMLRKTGVNVPAMTSTAAGPAVRPGNAAPKKDPFGAADGEAEPTVAEPLPPPRGASAPVVVPLARPGSLDIIALEDEGPSLEIAGASKPVAPRPVVRAGAGTAAVARPAMVSAAAGRDAEVRASSAAISVAASFVSAAAAAALVHNGGWGLGLSGVAALGACSFVAAALALDAAVRRRGPIAVAAIVVGAGLFAAGTTAAALATGGARTRALAAKHTFLAPLADLTVRGGGLAPTPEPAETAMPSETAPPPSSTPDETPASTPDVPP